MADYYNEDIYSHSFVVRKAREFYERREQANQEDSEEDDQ
jgi:hypothetical protein